MLQYIVYFTDKVEEMPRELKFLVVILAIAVILLSGCDDNVISINSETIANKELYNMITENIPEIKTMQCTLYKEISIKNAEIGFPDFYKEYIEESNKNEQRNKINTGALSYILDSINEYGPIVRFSLNELIGKGEYYVFEFSSVAIDDFNRQSIRYTILINKDSENRIRIWKHTNAEGFGSVGIYLPNYDIWDLKYDEIYDESSNQ